jgi:hypothetical protein
MSEPAGAILIQVDLAAPGDRLVTRDTSTGLDWVDLTESTGLSFNQIQAGAGGFLADGWRHGTGGQVCAVMSAVVSPLSPPARCPGSSRGAGAPSGQTAYTDLFGATTSAGAALGAYDDGDQSNGLTGRMILSQNGNTGDWSFGVFSNSTSVDATFGTQMGHFLMRPVPEPSTGLLTAMGLVFMGALRRSRGVRKGSTP